LGATFSTIFDVIVSRRRDHVLLVGANRQYIVTP
jgi:hypothetical protein